MKELIVTHISTSLLLPVFNIPVVKKQNKMIIQYEQLTQRHIIKQEIGHPIVSSLWVSSIDF